MISLQQEASKLVIRVAILAAIMLLVFEVIKRHNASNKVGKEKPAIHTTR